MRRRRIQETSGTRLRELDSDPQRHPKPLLALALPMRHSRRMVAQDELEARNAGWEQALLTRDVEAAADFLHEDYALVIVHPESATMRRTDWLGALPSYVIHRWNPAPPVVDIQGGFALVHQRVDMEATVFGQDRSGLFILTDCWRRDPDGAWRVWRRYSTPLSAGGLPPVTANAVAEDEL